MVIMYPAGELVLMCILFAHSRVGEHTVEARWYQFSKPGLEYHFGCERSNFQWEVVMALSPLHFVKRPFFVAEFTVASSPSISEIGDLPSFGKWLSEPSCIRMCRINSMCRAVGLLFHNNSPLYPVNSVQLQLQRKFAASILYRHFASFTCVGYGGEFYCCTSQRYFNVSCCKLSLWGSMPSAV